MPIVQLGIRRLYDALGVSTPTVGEIRQSVDLVTGETVTLYVGAKPPLGATCLEGNQYCIPGRDSFIFQANGEYSAPCFLEMTVSISREVTQRQLELLQEGDKNIREEFLSEIPKRIESAEQLLDVVSGAVGLNTHRQFVLKPLVENRYLSGQFDSVSSFVGPVMEMLSVLELNANTGPHLKRLLERLGNLPEGALRKGGATLHWLLRAWRERDEMAKFMYLFVPLEAILQSTRELGADSKTEFASIEAIVRASGAENMDSLLGFLERTKTKFGPSLNARFEEFARSAAMPGWEIDVKAFKKFNRMRNLLLHAADKNVRSHINFEENTRTLEDLVERYVSVALLGSSDVYQSKWRPQREIV
jgi:hypothetical protein